MTETPTFLRRKISAPPTIDSDIRDILARLKASADRDVCEVLAGATNVYLNAIVRFTGQGMFKAKDVDNLITVWQILLDVGRADLAEFAGRSNENDPQPEDEGSE